MIDPKLSLEVRQKALELEMRGLGILNYRRILRKAREKGREGATQHGVVLMKRALDDVAEGIRGFLSEMGESQRGAFAGACPLLRRVDTRVAALIGLRVIIDGLIGGSPVAAIASKVGRRLEDEVRFQAFRRVPVTMRHIKGAGSISQVSSVILGYSRNLTDPAASRVGQLSVLKNRHGGRTGPADCLLYDEASGRLLPVET